MSDPNYNKPNSDKVNPPFLPQSEAFNQAFGDIREKAQEALNDNQETVEKAQSFYEQNEDGIKAFVFIGVVLLLNKRMVAKALRRELKNLIIIEPTTI